MSGIIQPMKKIMSSLFLLSLLLLIAFHPFIIKYIMSDQSSDTNQNSKTINIAYFAGGCFWCMEPVFDSIDGVKDTIVGYMGGTAKTANYESVSTGKTAHIEAIKVVYDSAIVSYNTLINAFWKSIDPTDAYGQFSDKGPQYKTAIYYSSEEEHNIANLSKQLLIDQKKFTQPIVTQLIPVSDFFEAEDYHQNYYQKNTIRYNAYKIGSGRAKFINNVWN